MATQVGSILRHCTKRENEPFEVLTFPTHERTQSNLKSVHAHFDLLWGDHLTQNFGVKGNGWISTYAPMPKNTNLLEKVNGNDIMSVLPPHKDYDMVIGQHRFGQGQLALQLGQHLNVPVLILEHTSVTSDHLRNNIENLKQIRGDINVFISENNMREWGWSLEDPSVVVITHGVQTELFKPRKIEKKIHVLSVVNDWVNRGDILGFDIFQRVVMQNNIPHFILGDTQGLSQPAKNLHHLVQSYNESAVFFNTSRYSPIPSVCLEAMACGIPVVSTDNNLIQDIIVNGYNGFRTNNENEMKSHLQRLLQSPDECKQLGENARKTIIEKFSLADFTSKWDNLLERAFNIRK